MERGTLLSKHGFQYRCCYLKRKQVREQRRRRLHKTVAHAAAQKRIIDTEKRKRQIKKENNCEINHTFKS